jgi:hypothetical protein
MLILPPDALVECGAPPTRQRQAWPPPTTSATHEQVASDVTPGDCPGEFTITHLTPPTTAATRPAAIRSSRWSATTRRSSSSRRTFFGDQPTDLNNAGQATASDDCDGGRSQINELHRQRRHRRREPIEVAGSAGFDLGSVDLVLYNAPTAWVYSTINLSGLLPDEGCGPPLAFFEPGIQRLARRRGPGAGRGARI